MTTVDEFTQRGYEVLQPTLNAALDLVGQIQRVTFYRYTKYVLPLDGFVFWYKTGQVVIEGVLHYTSDKTQEEEHTVSISDCVFTTRVEVAQFSDINPDQIFVAHYDPPRNPNSNEIPPPLVFAFSRRAPLLRQAGLFHYSGHALYSTMATQLVDDVSQIDPTALIVSSSLPAWLQLKSYQPIWLIAGNPQVTLYPSYAVPDNLPPPYGVVHVLPESTRALQATPWVGLTGSRHVLASERVRITLYGCDNDVASDWLDLVWQYSRDTSAIGIMGGTLPAIRDERYKQVELTVLAQRKTIDFEVSYHQSRIRQVAQQLVKEASLSLYPQVSGPEFIPAMLGASFVWGESWTS